MSPLIPRFVTLRLLIYPMNHLIFTMVEQHILAFAYVQTQ